MRKHMKIGPRVAIITSAMVLAGTMAACGNNNTNKDNPVSATVSDASEMEEDAEVTEDAKGTTEVADAKDSEKKEKATTEASKKDSKADDSTTESKKAEAKADSKTDSKAETKPSTTQAPSNSGNSNSGGNSKPSTTKATTESPKTSKPSTTQAPSNSGNSSSGGNSKPSTTQATTEAPKKEHSWTTTWTPKIERVKIADEFKQLEYGAARRCRDCGQASLASTWNGDICPICGEGGNYTTTSDLPTGNYITEPAVYEDQIVGYTLTLKCSSCGETRTFECDKNQNGNIDYSGYCKK